MGVAVGIDLGTTNSCVAIVQGDQAKIVESVYGDRIHPSVICFHPSGEVLAGPRAKERMAIDPENTIYSFKRLLGQQLDAPEINKLIGQLPYDVIERNGIPVLQTRNKEATLPEVSALMLKYLREMCEETFGVRIDEAIITVPANFTDVQRASTKIAGRIAGFNVLRILNEPTAAALAYGFGGDKEERIAVYDFGGGTFDITVIELLDDIFEVLSTAGDNFLGGDDFDEKIVYDMLKQFEKKHGFRIEDDPIAMQRIRSVAERAKCQLSSINEVNATLRELVTDKHGRKIDFSFTITRERFEQLASSLIERSLATCEEALELAKLKPENLDNVVLVGGTTRIPMVRQKVEEFFGCKPKTQINPDEVVAIGAAINAFSLTQEALDPTIKPKKRANLTVDPFSSKPESKAQPRTQKDAADPFSSEKSPLADMSDPFADRKHPISSKPPRTLGKIDLSQKRTMIGMGGGATEITGKPSSKKNTAASTTTPAATDQSESIDLPGLPSNASGEDDMVIPPPAHHMDSELDSWGEPKPPPSTIPGQKRPSMADDPDLPVPLDRPSHVPRGDIKHATDDAELPIPVGLSPDEMDLPTTTGEMDLPTTTGEMDLPTTTGDMDLPTTTGEMDLPTTTGETDLPTTSGKMDLPTTTGETDLPTTSGKMDLPTTTGETDLPTTSGETNLPTTRGKTDLPTTSGETDLPTNTGDRNLPIPMAPPLAGPVGNTGQYDDFGQVVIEEEKPTSRRDDTSSFAPGERAGRSDNTDEIEALDDVDIEEISDVTAHSISPPRYPSSPSEVDSSEPLSEPAVGAKRPITSPQGHFAASEPPPAFARRSQSLPPAFESDLDDEPAPSRKISYHPYHPLDEVVGDDGREAQSETHEAFVVPVKNATPAVLLDVSPRGLGIATAGGYCDIIIERNAAIPIEQSRHFSTSRDNQSEVFIEVYQGESRRTEDNTQLGRIELRDLRPAPRGEISILVTFEVDTDGILNVRAVNEETNASQSTQIKLSGGLADDQVEALVEKYAENAK